MKRDQVVGVVAALVAAVSAALPWINHVDVLYETNGRTSLGAFGVPVTFLVSGASDTPGGSIPAVAVIVAVVALGLIVWTFLPRTPRRVLYLVWGLLAMAAPVLLYLQLQSDIEAKQAIANKAVFAYFGIGPFFLMGAGLIAIVAGVIGAGKSAATEVVGAPVTSQPAPYGSVPYGGGVADAQQPWAAGAVPGAVSQAPVQQDWGVPPVPQPPPAPQWGQPQPQQWDQPAPQQWEPQPAPQQWEPQPAPQQWEPQPQQWDQPAPQQWEPQPAPQPWEQPPPPPPG